MTSEQYWAMIEAPGGPQDQQRIAERARLETQPSDKYPGIRRLLDYLDAVRPIGRSA